MDIGPWFRYLRRLGKRCESNVFAYEYSGYGLSGGRPSERNLYADIESVVKTLVCNKHMNCKRIILLGESIGSVPSIYLASSISMAGVILKAPLMSAIRTMYHYSGNTWTFDPFPNIELISKVDCPILIIHGTEDKVIDISHGISLYKRCRHPVSPLWVSGRNHSTLRLDEQFFPRI
ncbi:unnamed protein product, partial [Oppiella nova]